MSVVMRVLAAGASAKGEHPHDGEPLFVKAFDVDAHDGFGMVEYTDQIDEAFAWPTIAEAFDDYRRQSTVKPQRADGKPNRPLTALTVAIEDQP